jgi:hypothetical protein
MIIKILKFAKNRAGVSLSGKASIMQCRCETIDNQNYRIALIFESKRQLKTMVGGMVIKMRQSIIKIILKTAKNMRQLPIHRSVGL